LENNKETIVNKRYDHYVTCNLNGIIKKDCCKNCSPLKQKESNLLVYNVDSTNKIESVLQKKREKLAHDFSYVEKCFENKEYILLDKTYKNSLTPLKYLCIRHIDKGEQKIAFSHLLNGQGCKYCRYEKISGENHYNWNGGVTTLNVYLRDRLREWTFNSMKNNNFTCSLTGKKGGNLNVHHIYGFSLLMSETLQYLGLRKKKVDQFTKEELENIKNVIFEKHNNYGIVLCEEIHKLFHKLYGKGNNTPNQFEEFKIRLRLGEFNIFLEENKINLII
jgi:hypothetical protein